MSARALRIVERVAPLEYFPAVPENFVVADDGPVPAQIVLDSPDLSLYCLDDANQQAYFVQTPPGVDLAAAPFYYLAQYQHAQRLITLPYETLHSLADGLPDARTLILVYSVGRCGSTLISQALNAVGGVRSLSEPDVYAQVMVLRHKNRRREEEYARLVRTCTRILGRGTEVLAVKFRSGGIHLGDLIHGVYPDARNLFVSRHAERWLDSMNAGFTENMPGPEAQAVFSKYLMASSPLIMPFVRRHRRQPSQVEGYALSWLSTMDKYLTLRQAGVPFLPIRYEAIQAEPKSTVETLLAYCGLPTDRADDVCNTFSVDSQEGTALSRASRQRRPAPPLGPQDYAAARAVLAEHPTIQTPDFDAAATPAAASPG